MKTFLAAALVLSSVTAAQAGFVARFVEGAPKDTFVLEAAPGACAVVPLSVTFDLTGSDGQLIFDVTDAGAGVEVFQPFELVRGAERVTAVSDVVDGDRLLQLEVSDLPEAATVVFTIDVDDTLGAREITVGRSEIVGAKVTVSDGTTEMTGVFDSTSTTRIDWPDCV